MKPTAKKKTTATAKKKTTAARRGPPGWESRDEDVRASVRGRAVAAGPTDRGDALMKKAEAVNRKLQKVNDKIRAATATAHGMGRELDRATAMAFYEEASALQRLYVDYVNRATEAYRSVKA